METKFYISVFLRSLRIFHRLNSHRPFMRYNIVLCAICALLFINPVPLLAGTAHPPIDCASRAEKAFNLHLSGHSQLALDSFNACLKKNSKDKNTLLFFIKLLPENSSSPYYTDLFKLADASIKEKNTGLIPYLSLCKYYRNKNQLNSAFANCKKALMIDPISYAVYRELGLTYSKSKNPQKAIENFNRAINISSANYKARYMAAEEYFKIKNNKPALKNYLKAFNLMPSGARNTAFASHLSKRIKMTRNRIAKKNKLRQKGSVRAEKAKNEKCIAKAEKYARQDRLEEAYAQISTCLKRDKSNSKARMFSADILVRLGKYEAAIQAYKNITEEKYFQKELKAYCQMKIAEIYSRMNDNKLAILHYGKSIKINNRDINALLKISKCLEKESNYKKAAHYYKMLLEVEPGNIFAARKIKELRVKTMSNSDILEEMKLRLMINKKTETLTRDTKELFHLVRMAETKYAVDYLKDKNVLLAGRVLETRNKDGKFKLLLNAKGFYSYRWLMTRESVRFFEKKGIGLKTIFVLKDKKGAIIFDKKGNLTNEGLIAYWDALKGQKSWLMPHEKPKSDIKEKKAEKENPKVTLLLSNGYREITEPEFLWLLKATNCPPEVLMPPEKTYLQIIKTKKKRDRYFLCYITPSACSLTGHNAILATYMEKYRAGNNYIPTSKTSTAFFGTGAVQSRKFCHEGKIWNP